MTKFFFGMLLFVAVLVCAAETVNSESCTYPGNCGGESAILEATIATLPVNPPVGTRRFVTDSNDCVNTGGTGVDCRFDGSAWVPVGGIAAEVDTDDSTHKRGNWIVANSPATSQELRSDASGTNKLQAYHDATTGWVVKITPEADRRSTCPTDKLCGFWDEEANQWAILGDVDSGGVGQGTFTVQDGYRIVGGTYTRLNICQGSSATTCGTWTDATAAFDEKSSNFRLYFDLSEFQSFRITAFLSVAAVTADIEIQCDVDSTFASPVTLGTLNNPASNGNVGSWTAIPANECATAGGVWLRLGMVNGNTTEDPAIRNAGLELR